MADLLGISMPKAYELTHQPGFPVIRVGRKALINKDMLLTWMAEQSAPKGE
ncbi:MAG: helix-turn-helix domain-containing protein [Clostridia bacterium]|nr:helix-turn-helix domain-containing protein [Clostridia bacterium]